MGATPSRVDDCPRTPRCWCSSPRDRPIPLRGSRSSAWRSSAAAESDPRGTRLPSAKMATCHTTLGPPSLRRARTGASSPKSGPTSRRSRVPCSTNTASGWASSPPRGPTADPGSIRSARCSVDLYAFIVPGPKLADLRRDPRYALHSETFPPPRHDDGAYVTGRVAELDEPHLREALTDQVLAERGLSQPWPGFEREPLLELHVESVLITLTQSRDGLAVGHTVWRP